MRRVSPMVLCFVAAMPSDARASDDLDWLIPGKSAIAQPASTEESDADAGETIEGGHAFAPFGQADSWRWAIYGGGATDFDGAQQYNLHFSAEYFLANDFSVNLELGALHFDQVQDTFGVNFNTLIRWHMIKGDGWTIYGDAGAGLLATGEDVPDGGTNFDFTPQAGMGATFAIGDDGARLMAGLRWYHISNARTDGNEHNPGRNSLMAYIGVSFPW